MKKQLLGAVIVLTGLFALATGAQAETGDIVVKIDQDFVAGERLCRRGTIRSYGTRREPLLCCFCAASSRAQRLFCFRPRGTRLCRYNRKCG